MDGCCRIGLEEYGCKIMENKGFDRTDWAFVVRVAKAKLKSCSAKKEKAAKMTNL